MRDPDDAPHKCDAPELLRAEHPGGDQCTQEPRHQDGPVRQKQPSRIAHEVALALVGYVFLVALTFAFTRVFSGRGAYTQIGALIGTIMVANVFVIIIPYQKKWSPPARRHGARSRSGARRQAALGP